MPSHVSNFLAASYKTGKRIVSCRVHMETQHCLMYVNLHTHGNMRDCTRNYETQKRKETEKYYVLQNMCF